MKQIRGAMAALALALCMPVAAQAEEPYISDAAKEACMEIGETYGICPELLQAIIERESGGDPWAENGSCKGLMQVSVKWHKGRMDRLGVADIFDERGNILVGADYLSELFEKYGDAALVLDIFAGDSRAESNYEDGVLSAYAKGILERSEQLERAHGK